MAKKINSKVFLLLDRSGSMGIIWRQAIDSINAYVEALKGNVAVEVAVFDSDSYDIIRSTSTKDYKAIEISEIKPRGSTPLYDAFTRTANIAIEENYDKTIVVVMTDGFENASMYNTHKDVTSLVDLFENEKKWPVVFLGANFKDIHAVSASLGGNASRTRALNPDELVVAMNNYGGAHSHYLSTGDIDSVTTDDWVQKSTK